jgi:tetratricopeptide (TPR) repeat protein
MYCLAPLRSRLVASAVYEARALASVRFFAILLAFAAVATAQTAPRHAAPVDPAKIAGLLDSGHCPEGLPLVKKAYAAATDADLKRRLAAGGVRCAMTLNNVNVAAELIQMLSKDFPRDPDVLYLAVHTYSDLSLRASQTLLFSHPDAYQVHELNAEALETQGKWDEAVEEYRVVLKQHPDLPGMHYRIGRALLSKPESPMTRDEAKKEFEEELRIDPNNAGAEFVLAELARQAEDYKQAIERFTKAAKLDVMFADAYIGLGRSLLASDKPADAIAPLETAVKLQPDNPTAHFQLANAYRLTKRKEESDREFLAYKQAAEKARQTTDELKKAVSGITEQK